MRDLDWYSGDTHAHIHHPPNDYTLLPSDAWLVGRAEGLDIVHCLDGTYHFSGGPDTVSTDECIVYMTEEFRSLRFGHQGLLGLSRIVEPMWGIWWPLPMDQADSTHAQGGVVTAAHPATTDSFFQVDDWPGTGLYRGLPMDVIGGRLDAFEVLSMSNKWPQRRELPMWCSLLNSGFRIHAAAGSDARLDWKGSNPIGSFKTYVRISGEFTTASWLEGLVQGRTFVTSGPLIPHFDVAGKEAGDTLLFSGSGSWDLDGSIEVTCAHPLARIDLIVNGEQQQTFLLNAGRTNVDTTFSVTIDRTAWIAARVYGVKPNRSIIGDSLFAHTSPVYITVNGDRLAVTEDIQHFVDWLADLEDLVVTQGSWESPDDSTRVLDEILAARGYYLQLLEPTSVVSAAGSVPTRPSIVVRNSPNPFVSEVLFDVDVSLPMKAGRENPALVNEPASLIIHIYDVRGRLVRRLVSEPLDEKRHVHVWDGRDDLGQILGSGVYFASFVASGTQSTRKLVLLR
jgi:hypothetical protein